MEQPQNTNQALYGEQTRLTLENMTFSGVPLSRYPAYLRAAAQVKTACARANAQAGLLSEEKAKAIEAACRKVAFGDYDGQFPVDVYHGGGGIGINMNLNEVIASLAGEDIHPVNDVNCSQSTSDVCHTSLRLALLEGLEALDGEAAAWVAQLKELAHRFDAVPTIARTCWQDGIQISAGALFSATASAISRQRAELQRWRETLHQVNLGWTVIGDGTGAPKEYREKILPALCAVTGRSLSWQSDLMDAAQYPDDVAAVSSAVTRLSEILAKFSRDLRLLSSGPDTGLKEMQLPAVQAGSSFFPGKVNPVLPEMMIQCAMLIGGSDSVIQRAVGLGEVHINLWEELMGFLLLESIDRLRAAMERLRVRCVSGIVLNEDVCREYAAARIPQIVAYKETYGYAYLSRRIKAEGLEAVTEDLRRNPLPHGGGAR